ncbi:MAG: adenylosuccinate lyase [Gammaproteobacteria bacterium]|nr:adenylosuccinate lyase [Gammaproteobacteria bacterium]
MINSSTLLALSPLDGRYVAKTAALQYYFSEYALFKYRFIVEAKWFCYLLTHANELHFDAPPPSALKKIEERIEHFSLEDAKNIKQIEETCQHDVKAVEYFLKNILKDIPELAAYTEWVHFACTSEDINNLAYALMIKECLQTVLLPKLHELLDGLRANTHLYAETPMLARTHGQAASPTTVGKEFANFTYRLKHYLSQLENVRILGKFNGAVGNYNAHRVTFPSFDWPAFMQQFVESLGLVWNPYTTQIEPHDYVADLLSQFSNMHAVLTDFSRDIWGYISLGYFKQKISQETVGSSTMPHKVNPIDFENAEGNLALSQALAQFLSNRLPVSRFQRDLVDSTLMRNVGSVFGYAIIAYDSLLKGLNKLIVDHERIEADLNQHPEILAEAIQTIMRANGLPLPYEQLKALTRGQKIELATLTKFVESLSLPEDIKKTLLALRPADYVGYAKELAQKI